MPEEADQFVNRKLEVWADGRRLPRGRVADVVADDEEAVAGAIHGEGEAREFGKTEEWSELGAPEVEGFEARVVASAGSIGAD